MTYSQFKLGEGRHVDDTDGLFAAFHFCSNNVEPVWLVEGLTLVQRQQIYTHMHNQVEKIHAIVCHEAFRIFKQTTPECSVLLVSNLYLSLEEQSIWAFQNHVSPSSGLPGCPGGHTEGWSAADAQSESPSEEPSVHTAGLQTNTHRPNHNKAKLKNT